MFDPVDPKQSFPALERGILRYWAEEDTFKRSIRARSGGQVDDPLDGPGGGGQQFSFYDGPPFATGLPHYGHLLAGTIKDVIPRYQTMRGKRVERRFGWDCHGLPIENIIEKEHGITDKRQIEEMGVRAFNNLCRKTVQRFTGEWRTVVERMGRWVDMDWDYRTMDADYMESIWWVFKALCDKGLVYEGHKPMHICPRCATPLANFEVTQGYKDRTDQSVIITFPLKDDPQTRLLAWTTTPWSLPGNMWLAVGPDIAYAQVKSEGVTYILAEKLVEKVFGKNDHEIIGAVTAKDLKGLRYEPLFSYFEDTIIPSTKDSKKPRTYGDTVFKVIMNDAVEVSDAEGTGIVHLTSSTGEDSNAAAVAEGVDVLAHVQMDGYFVPAVTDFQGIHVKPEGKDPMSTDKAVIDHMKKRGRVFSQFTITHSYPHCWRCDTPLLPYTTGSWFVKAESLKQDMLAANAQTQWVPGHIRDGRFGKWLEGARDWAVSRRRYWGTPLPIWIHRATGEMQVIGSREALMDKAVIRFTRLTVVRHGESVGNVTPRYQGREPGTDLTERGLAQAAATGERLKGEKVTRVYCSPLARTRQTAQAIADAVGVEPVIDDRLREVAFGEYEGKSIDFSDLAFVKARRAHKLESNQVESIYHFPGMETWSQVQTRVDAFLKELLLRHPGEHVVVVTHADPLLSVKHFFTGQEPQKLVHQPYPRFAEPHTFYWDHRAEAPLDLHKETVDGVAWPGAAHALSVHATLVRHGETDWNKQGLVQGNTDLPLNDTGRKQAAERGKALKGRAFDVIVCSDLSRARETAEIMAKELGLGVSAAWPELRERDFGTWNGLKLEEVQQNYPDGPAGNPAFHPATPEKGESLQKFLARLETAHDRLLTEFPGKRVLMVAHRGTIQGLLTLTRNLSHREGVEAAPGNGEAVDLDLHPRLTRIPDVLDCWFESGAMPYAQSHFPFSARRDGEAKPGDVPAGFPADFIAEGIDQTRGWFYTLTVLGTALFQSSPFRHVIVNGTVLAEDGKKMSKKLKNYPDPLELVEKHGADAVRFALMGSPAVRGEDLRFSGKLVEEQLRNVLLPLWNTYSFFVTYANDAGWSPVAARRASSHPLDVWIRAELQDLVNRMTAQMEDYDLSATCAELADTVDALTNWYVRLSRRRFAGKSGLHAAKDGETDQHERGDAFSTLHDVLLTFCQLLAPFCPFITEGIYLNLVTDPHGSVHLTDWPQTRDLTPAERALTRRQRLLRDIVSLGLKIRSDRKIKVRQPLAKVTVAIPDSFLQDDALTPSELALLQEELNVKAVDIVSDPGRLATAFVQVDARKAGPRLGGRVQEIIQAGKRGEFAVNADGTVTILGVTLTSEEAAVLYRGREGEDIAAHGGVVVSLDTRVTPELELEGRARDLIRAVQQLRKDAGLSVSDRVTLAVEGDPELMAAHGALVLQETNASAGTAGDANTIDLGGRQVTVRIGRV